MIGLPTRQKKILKKLMSLDGWVKGKELAEEMAVTPRTIRADIAAINVWLKTVGCYIESSRQEGYRLRGERQGELESLLCMCVTVHLCVCVSVCEYVCLL